MNTGVYDIISAPGSNSKRKYRFSEALRCQSVKAYNATLEMCRRALDSSCLQLGADPKLGTLQKMIDWLYSQGKITSGTPPSRFPFRAVRYEANALGVMEFN
jgi:hypothetical protein